MKHRLDKTLALSIKCDLGNDLEWADDREGLLGDILREWELRGDAIWGLDKRGRFCWKASPQLRRRLRF